MYEDTLMECFFKAILRQSGDEFEYHLSEGANENMTLENYNQDMNVRLGNRIAEKLAAKRSDFKKCPKVALQDKKSTVVYPLNNVVDPLKYKIVNKSQRVFPIEITRIGSYDIKDYPFKSFVFERSDILFKPTHCDVLLCRIDESKYAVAIQPIE